MSDHLGVNDIPEAKSLKNNDRSTALAVNAPGTSAHICAETVPTDGHEQLVRTARAICARWPTLEPHCRKLLAAARRGEKAKAAELVAGLEIAVRAFATLPAHPVQPDMED